MVWVCTGSAFASVIDSPRGVSFENYIGKLMGVYTSIIYPKLSEPALISCAGPFPTLLATIYSGTVYKLEEPGNVLYCYLSHLSIAEGLGIS